MSRSTSCASNSSSDGSLSPRTGGSLIAAVTTIETNRLRLVAWSPEHLLALIESEAAFAERFETPPAPGLRGFFVSEEVSPAWLEQLRAASGADLWVHGFAVVHRAEWQVVGTAGFKGPPDADGIVEIGYGIVPAYEGRGLATEAVVALVDHAGTDPRVRTVRAHTLPAHNASTRVLEKCGFAFVAEVVDPDDGPVWRWEQPVGQRAAGS